MVYIVCPSFFYNIGITEILNESYSYNLTTSTMELTNEVCDYNLTTKEFSNETFFKVFFIRNNFVRSVGVSSSL